MVQKKTKNPLPSSYRGKKRYIQFQLASDKPLLDVVVFNALQDAFAHWFGQAGLAHAKLHLIGFDSRKKMGIVRVHYLDVFRFKIALILIQRVGNQVVMPEVTKTSGSLAKLMASK